MATNLVIGSVQKHDQTYRDSYKVSLHDSVYVPNVEEAADPVEDPIQLGLSLLCF